MKVIVDTNIWSYALRRKTIIDYESAISALNELILLNSVVFIGPVRQELLTGFRAKDQFEKLKLHLRQFSDHPIQSTDYELAAEFQTICSTKGVQGSPVDFLICAIAHNNDFEIFTLDKDFIHYRQHIPIHLYKVL